MMPPNNGSSEFWKQYREVIVTFVLVLVLSWLYTNRTDDSDWQAAHQWLHSHKLAFYSTYLKSNGIDSLYKLQEWISNEHLHLSPVFEKLPSNGQSVVIATRNDGVLQTWMNYMQLSQYSHSVRKAGILSLKQLGEISDEVLRKIMSKDYLKVKVMYVDKSAEEREEIWRLMLSKWAMQIGQDDVLYLSFKRMMIYIGVTSLCVVAYFKWLSVLQVYCYVLNKLLELRVPSYWDVIDKLTGRYLYPSSCRVEWGWHEPQVVGNSFSFIILLLQRNWAAYRLQKRDNLHIEISHQGVDVPPSVEFLHDTQHSGVTKVKVTLMVYKAGVYKISVLIRGEHIQDSPYQKTFNPDAIMADKCALVNHTSIQLATERVQQYMFVELRDRHNNSCTYCEGQQDFTLTLHESDTDHSVSPDLRVIWEPSSKRVIIKYQVNQAGAYTATLHYQKTKLNNGQFTLIALTDADMAKVIKNATKQCDDTYFEAKLLKNDKQKKVYCYISPRQLTIKEFYMKIFSKRLYTFRVCPFVKFTFQGADAMSKYPVLVVNDDCQPPIILSSKDRNLIVATYANHLIKNIGGSETFKHKQDFFYSELRRLHLKRHHTRLPLKVHREHLLQSSYKATKDMSLSDWCKNFEITFVGEAGLDWGGVRREWFEVLSVCLFDASHSGMFTQFQEDAQGLVHPNPRRAPTIKLKYYEFAGKVVGKCLYESSLGGGYRQLVKAKFTRSFLAQLLGLRVNYKYFEQDDPDLYMSKVRYIEEHGVEGLDVVFAEEEYQDGKLLKVVDLIPGGSTVKVTEASKLQYLDALAQYRLCSQVHDEVESFLKGLHEIVPDNLLSIFDEYELELLLCGMGEYSVSDLKEFHKLCSSEPEFLKSVNWLWTILSGFTQQDMARFLQFVTGCSQLPSGGFKELQPPIQISAAPTYGVLPTAHTCFNQLCLPEYSCLEHMHQALKTAINEGNQGFGLV